jgi:hypothetical protein
LVWILRNEFDRIASTRFMGGKSKGSLSLVWIGLKEPQSLSLKVAAHI